LVFITSIQADIENAKTIKANFGYQTSHV